MSKLVIATIFAAGLYSIAPVVARGDEPQKLVRYGPVVSAYLTGLVEELNELEYQLKNREIDRSDYDRAKERLMIMRRQVEHLALQRGEDQVPELQILADDELSELGLGRSLNPEQLRLGALPGGQWKLIGIERGRTRYFIFDRLPLSVSLPFENVSPNRRKYDPLSVIETIVIRDRAPLPQPPSAPATPAPAMLPTSLPSAAQPEAVSVSNPAAAPASQFESPQILRVHLPRYTDQAREKSIVGDLVVRALFQVDGRIRNLKIEKGLGFGLDQQALDSVKKMEYEPAQFGGRKVNALAEIVFHFQLDRISFYLRTAEPQMDAVR